MSEVPSTNKPRDEKGDSVVEHNGTEFAFIFSSTDVCNKWLVGLDSEGRLVDYDGGHDTEQEVAKALELRKQIRCINPEPGTRFIMLTVEEVPDFTGEDPINGEAVDACNIMSEATGK